MTPNEERLATLVAQNAMSLAQLSSVISSFALELSRSSDPSVRRACGHALAKLGTVSSEMDRQWISLTELTGVQRPPFSHVEEVVLLRKA
ncbi:hypothetical protein [Pseudomonas sp. Marseille-QA0892]